MASFKVVAKALERGNGTACISANRAIAECACGFPSALWTRKSSLAVFNCEIALFATGMYEDNGWSYMRSLARLLGVKQRTIGERWRHSSNKGWKQYVNQ